jgi:hypothetical protein
MPAPSRTGLAAIVAVVLAGMPASAAVPAPRVIPPRAAASVVPVHVGMSLAYRYELEQTGPRGTTTTRASVALTRVAGDRVTVTLTPEAGEPTAVVGRIATDGTLHLDTPTDERGTDAGAADIPQDTPLGGLPDDPRGSGASQAGTGNGRYGGRNGYGTGAGGRGAQTPAWAALASLLAFRATGGTTTPSWTFSAPVGPAVTGPVPLLALTARATTAQNGLVETVVADGRGDVQLAATTGSPGAYGGRTGGTRRRGGTQGGGYPGGGQDGNTGTGQGGYPGGGQGGYPSRRGGQNGGQSSADGSGGIAVGRPVPATVVLHVESVFRDGRLASARGTQTSTLHGGGTDVTTTSRWTLAAY